ncbi:hypothetical protein CU098_008378 [Rhizopus stolonifer]|uniref:SCD domain-containing protein n=1 Tax=Rhizopus stolonifer TaxID=4846 RepID=A0A367KX24_RHIST|nr:hypothetical protein CU098_008378 [Rhizopus stolonifer]
MAKSQKKPAATVGSSRVSLRPKTVPSLFAKQRTSASKVITQQEETSDNEEQDDELESSDSSASDYNSDSGPKSSRKRKSKKTTKKTNITVASNSQLLEPISQSQSEQHGSLYDRILDPACKVDLLVSEWIERYNEESENSLKELINFVLRCSGCSMAVTDIAFSEEDGSVNALQELQDELVKLPSHDYPIVSKSKEDKAFRARLLLFFAELIDQTQHEAIHDGMLIETLQNWLTTMSSSTYRPFRHTATLIALKLINALCTVGENARNLSITSKNQFRAEERKRASKDTQKIRSLKHNITTSERKLKDVEEFLGVFFESIFVRRSRDVESIIRIECLEELHFWMLKFESYFVKNAYFRYFGWALNDQNASVRSEAIKYMLVLYKKERIAHELSDFTSRFKARIEQIALSDVDASARVQAIHLCSVLYSDGVQVLSAEGQKTLLSWSASEQPRIRHAVAPYVQATMETSLITPLIDEINNESRGRRNKSAKAKRSWVVFKSFAAFVVNQSNSILAKESNVQEESNMQVDPFSLSSALFERRSTIIANMVDALWSRFPELQDYQAMSEYLICDHSRSFVHDDDTLEIDENYRLSEEEESALVDALVAGFETTVEKGYKFKSKGEKRKLTMEPFMLAVKKEVSSHLVEALPKLLERHSGDAYKMARLVSLPKLMDLNVYLELRAEDKCTHLMQILVNVYQGAVLKDLVIHCAESLQHLSKSDALSPVVSPQLILLKEAIVEQVREACGGTDLVITRFNSALIHSISVSMFRLANLISFTDFHSVMNYNPGSGPSVSDCADALMDRATFGYQKEKVIAESSLAVVLRHFIWKCHSLSFSENEESTLERRRDWMIDKFSEVVVGSDVSPLPEVRAIAFGSLVDLCWLFCSDLFDTHNLARLKTRLSATLQVACGNYVAEQIEILKEIVSEECKLSESEKEAKRSIAIQVITSYARGLLMGVFEIGESSSLLEHYGSKYFHDADEVVETMLTEFGVNLSNGQMAVDGVCRSYLDGLQKSFTKNVGHSWRSIDKTLRLARLEATSLKNTYELNGFSQIICERIHLEGISFAIAKAKKSHDQNKDDEKDQALQFFKVLTVFGKDLVRARDIAKIHNHMEDCLRDSGLVVEQDKKEWEHYVNYIKTIDNVLKKKGLHSTKRANNAETPAPYVFEDMIEDLGDLGATLGDKRPLEDVDMEESDKRQRNV